MQTRRSTCSGTVRVRRLPRRSAPRGGRCAARRLRAKAAYRRAPVVAPTRARLNVARVHCGVPAPQLFVCRPSGRRLGRRLQANPPPPARHRAAPLDQPLLVHHPHPLAVDRDSELAPGERPDHPVAVRRVRLRDLDHRLLNRVHGRTPPRHRARLRCSVERLPADLQHARHRRQRVALGDEPTGPGDALAHSQPRNAFPAISSSYVFRPGARSSSASLRRRDARRLLLGRATHAEPRTGQPLRGSAA
jgi:hypothetical protein